MVSYDELKSWLASAGYDVKPLEPVPPGTLWGLAVSTRPPMVVKFHFVAVSSDNIAAGIAISFSREHEEAVNKLNEPNRIKLLMRLYRSLISMCPSCRIALQKPPQGATTIVAEKLLDLHSLTRQLVLDTAAMLVNIFIMVNVVLREELPGVKPSHGQAAGSLPYM